MLKNINFTVVYKGCLYILSNADINYQVTTIKQSSGIYESVITLIALFVSCLVQ